MDEEREKLVAAEYEARCQRDEADRLSDEADPQSVELDHKWYEADRKWALARLQLDDYDAMLAARERKEG